MCFLLDIHSEKVHLVYENVIVNNFLLNNDR